MPEEDHLISCFLESLRDKNLHMHLFGQKNVKVNECFDNALLYEDNCTWGGTNMREDSTEGSSHTSKHVNSKDIANIVLQRMRQEGRENFVPRGAHYPQAYICGIHFGNHPTGACQREANALVSGLFWCNICKKYCTHTTKTFYHQIQGPNQQYQQARFDQRGYQNQGYQNQGNPFVGGNVGNTEKPMPILGTQPSLPGAIAVRYVDVASDEGTNPHQDLVPVGMNYEEEYPYSDYPAEPIMDDYQQK